MEGGVILWARALDCIRKRKSAQSFTARAFLTADDAMWPAALSSCCLEFHIMMACTLTVAKITLFCVKLLMSGYFIRVAEKITDHPMWLHILPYCVLTQFLHRFLTVFISHWLLFLCVLCWFFFNSLSLQQEYPSSFLCMHCGSNHGPKS